MTTISFDRADPAFRADPYPALARLQRETPVFEAPSVDDGSPAWYALRFDDVVGLLNDPRALATKFPPEVLEPLIADRASPFNRLARLMDANLLSQDPPDHTRLRNLVIRAFTPRRVDGLRTGIEALIEKLLASVAERNTCDLIEDFAVPLPLLVIAELLGVPSEDRDRLKHWSDVLATLIDGSVRNTNLAHSIQAATELCEYLDGIIAQRRAAPRDDLISDLVQTQHDRDVLTDDELVAVITLILGAGHETTTNLIGNGLLTLLRHPDRLAALRNRPELLPSAVEELLRFEPPVHFTSRLASEDLVLRGVRVPKGGEVNLYIAAANRDPSVFDRPHEIDLERTNNRHLSFGNGAHFCIGAALARMEGQLAIGAILRRFNDLALEDGTHTWRAGNVLRGLETLRVRLGPSSGA